MMRVFPAMVSVLLLSIASLGQQFSHRLNNQDVIDMVSLGLSDDVVIDKIHVTDTTDFDTSITGLRTLKLGKVSDAVIRVMINTHGNPAMPRSLPATPPSFPNTSLPAEAGVYTMIHGTQPEIEPEIVNWQTGGVAKSHATLGLLKQDVNGKVMNPKSPTHLNIPVEFFIKTLEGTSATEYQLLRLHEKGNRREFRSVTGGVFHQSGGAQRDEIPFQPEKIGDRVWKVRLDRLQVGEYGFLAPGISSVSISSSGKMYTFGVNEDDHAAAKSKVTRTLPDSKVEVQVGSDGVAPPQSFGGATIGASSDANPTVRHDGITLDLVTPGGPADRAGIRAADIILAIDNHYLFTGEELDAEIKRHKPGTQVSIRYRCYSTIYDTSLVMGSPRQEIATPYPQWDILLNSIAYSHFHQGNRKFTPQ